MRQRTQQPFLFPAGGLMMQSCSWHAAAAVLTEPQSMQAGTVVTTTIAGRLLACISRCQKHLNTFRSARSGTK